MEHSSLQPVILEVSPGMPCLVDSLSDAVTSHPRIGVTVPHHVLAASALSCRRRAFVPGFRDPSASGETWIHNESVPSQHGMPLPFGITRSPIR